MIFLTVPDGKIKAVWEDLALSLIHILSTKLSYTDDMKLKEITTPSGKVYQITASDDGQISQIVTPAGYALKYTYKDNLLTSFTNEDGDTIRYEYDKEGHMTSWRDGNNVRQITNTYDEYGRVVKQVDAKGGVSKPVSYTHLDVYKRQSVRSRYRHP